MLTAPRPSSAASSRLSSRTCSSVLTHAPPAPAPSADRARAVSQAIGSGWKPLEASGTSKPACQAPSIEKRGSEQVLRALASRKPKGEWAAPTEKRKAREESVARHLEDHGSEAVVVDYPGWACFFILRQLETRMGGHQSEVRGKIAAKVNTQCEASRQGQLRRAVELSLRETLSPSASHSVELFSLVPDRAAESALSSRRYKAAFCICPKRGAANGAASPHLLPHDAKLATFAEEFASKLHQALYSLDPSLSKLYEVDLSSGVTLESDHPSSLELRGGCGEPLFLQSAPDGCPALRAGVCEGFELMSLCSKLPGHERWQSEDGITRLRAEKVLALDRLRLPARLIFRSPLHTAPHLSERQISVGLGLGRVREHHLRRLLEELTFAWKPLVVQRRADLLVLHEACDENQTLLESGLEELELEGVEAGMRVRQDPTSRGRQEAALNTLAVPARLEVGHPREVSNVRFLLFKKSLRRVGIHWLNEMQERRLFDILAEAGEEGGWQAAEEELGEIFVVDAAGDFMRIGKEIQPRHILQVSRGIQQHLKNNKSLDIKAFQNIMNAGGISWLTSSQLAIIFKGMADPEAGLELRDWLSRFAWDPMEAARDVQRALEQPCAEKRTKHSLRHLKSCQSTPWPLRRRKPSVVKPKSGLTFDDFIAKLARNGIGHRLALHQLRVLFDTIDQNGDGRISDSELRNIAEIRGNLEVKRDDDRDEEAEKQAADDLQSQLENVQQQIVAVVENDEGVTASALDMQGIEKEDADLLQDRPADEHIVSQQQAAEDVGDNQHHHILADALGLGTDDAEKQQQALLHSLNVITLNVEEGLSMASVVVDASPAPDNDGKDFGVAQKMQSAADAPEKVDDEQVVGDPPAVVVSTPSGKTARVNEAPSNEEIQNGPRPEIQHHGRTDSSLPAESKDGEGAAAVVAAPAARAPPAAQAPSAAAGADGAEVGKEASGSETALAGNEACNEAKQNE